MEMNTRSTGKYRIVIQGHLRESWTEWFDGFHLSTILNTNGQPVTILCGEAVDQSALFGILQIVHNFNLHLVAVYEVDHEIVDEGDESCRKKL